MGFSVARLELRERGSWFLSTGQGIELLLGRDHLVEKMRRFTAIYGKALKEQQANIARIDLRYANGLAVAWREPVAPTAADQPLSCSESGEGKSHGKRAERQDDRRPRHRHLQGGGVGG